MLNKSQRTPSMRKKSQRSQGKFLLRGQGVGALDDAALERRAKENARIAGRSRVRASDREQARRELLGRAVAPPTKGAVESRRAVSRDPSEPVVRRGRRVRTARDEDLQDGLERLINEGVEEAQHDMMVAAERRRRRRVES